MKTDMEKEAEDGIEYFGIFSDLKVLPIQ